MFANRFRSTSARMKFSTVLFGFCLAVMLLAISVATQTASAAPLFDARTDFNTGSVPQSVISADFNGDNKPDLATANYGSNSVSVLLGSGDGSFGTKTDFPAGSLPEAVTDEDFNGDQMPDLAVTNRNANTVSILLGVGDGSFGAPTSFPTGSTPLSVASADFNGDDKPDLVTANFNSADTDIDGTVSVLLGVGDGSFEPKTDFDAAYFYPRSVITADFNGDGKADLAVADAGSIFVSILLGVGDGSFGPRSDVDAGVGPESLTSGDFDGDGNADLAALNASQSSVSVLLGVGDGSFSEYTNFVAGTQPSSVTSGDFNGDGRLDLVTANDGGGDAPGTGSVSILIGDGGGGFGPALAFTTGPKPNSVTGADFNGDGKPDLATSNHDNFDTSNVSVLLGNGVPDPFTNPTSLDFAAQTLGTTSAARTVTVTNPGVAYPLLVGQVRATGPDANDFIVNAGNCIGVSVFSSDSCEVTVSFAPSAVGARAASLEFLHNGEFSPLSVTLAGSGAALPPVPGVPRISKVKVTGPKKIRKGKKATFKVKVSNSGNAPATGVKLKVSGKGVKAKKSVGNIAPGKTRTIKIKIKPKKPGKVVSSFKVTSSNAGGKTVKKKVTVRK